MESRRAVSISGVSATIGASGRPTLGAAPTARCLVFRIHAHKYKTPSPVANGM
jgi:hypothetical protein